jgi:hypothetical protein
MDDRITRVLSIFSNSFPNLWMIRINVDPFVPITAIPDPGDLAKSVGGKQAARPAALGTVGRACGVPALGHQC